jgi:hypothetical protein
MFTKLSKKYMCVTLSIVITILLLTFTLLNKGYIGVWMDGFRFFNNDSYSYRNEILDDKYFIDIDLENIEVNIGKVLFEYNNSKIVVYDIKNNNGVYEIVFRSYGNYSIDGGVLLSGIKHTKTNKGYFPDLIATAYTEYNGKVYESDVSAISNLIYKDGDAFGFYLLPYADVLEEGSNNVKIKIENLCMNEWIKK